MVFPKRQSNGIPSEKWIDQITIRCRTSFVDEKVAHITFFRTGNGSLALPVHCIFAHQFNTVVLLPDHYQTMTSRKHSSP